MLRRVALIIFYDNKKHILLQERKGMSKWGEEWAYFGGGIEEGESPEEAVVRETEEELNFKLDDFRYAGKVARAKLKDDIFTDLFVFISPLNNKMREFTLGEGSAMRLFTIQEARKLKMVPGDEKVLDMLEKIL